MTYTLKSDEYESFQFDGTNLTDLRQWLNGYRSWPSYAISFYLTEDGMYLYLVNQGYAEVGPFSIAPGQYVVVSTKNRSGSAKDIQILDDLTTDFDQVL